MMGQKIRARIIGTGSYTPPRRITNADFEKIVDTSDEWIVTRTGIKERRIADDSIHGSDMTVHACRNALQMAQCQNDEIDLLVVGTVTPDYRLPSTACVVQEKMGLHNAVAFDVAAALGPTGLAFTPRRSCRTARSLSNVAVHPHLALKVQIFLTSWVSFIYI